jgi:hypothetical protein
MIYLYIKIHNVTGLKYLGKTKSKDPSNYKGSGKHWKRHIEKHGYDVTTEILFQSEEPVEIKEVGLYYSKLWNIVESKEWANLKEESGDGGWNDLHLELAKRARLEKYGVACIMKLDFISKKVLSSMRKTLMEKYGVENASQIPHIKEKIKQIYKEIGHQRGPKNSQYGTMWITNGTENKKIKVVDIIPEGWYKGRVIKNSGG